MCMAAFFIHTCIHTHAQTYLHIHTPFQSVCLIMSVCRLENNKKHWHLVKCLEKMLLSHCVIGKTDGLLHCYFLDLAWFTDLKKVYIWIAMALSIHQPILLDFIHSPYNVKHHQGRAVVINAFTASSRKLHLSSSCMYSVMGVGIGTVVKTVLTHMLHTQYICLSVWLSVLRKVY